MYVYCADCNRSLSQSGARIVINEEYVCGDCAYYRETGKYNPRKKTPDRE